MKFNRENTERFSVRELFCLVCCPPLPSKIVAKIAFKPPEPSYVFASDSSRNNRITFLESDINIANCDRDNLECFFARTSRGNRIACMFVKRCPLARYTILFSHGNASDIGLMYPFFLDLCNKVCCNVFGYDYSGYGVSTGRPSEKNMYADIDCVWRILISRYNIRPENIILYGQSLGSVPTVDLAARRKVGAVVLHSPILSALRVVYPQMKKTWCCDSFLNIEKVENISSPVLVIHGNNDETVPFSHGVTLFEKCPCSVNPLWVCGAGHNTVEFHDVYLERLKNFVHIDLKNFD
ncbi:unnamed protein product [Nezara viridula]|uniref:Serine aminopeptidase S33 domain-containing protein n=1 Tax=Nezara viridula TaxID=85310 RepID=A0A9P0MQP7_NEZVI|nr:unnamed protein product [Nezara viridula]